MNLLSINYLHAGAPKYWYAISPTDADRFETLASSLFPAARQKCKEFLRHKRYLISPSRLQKAGIRYTTQVQRPGDAIITFPGSYHFGFNTGFNVAESTNFAVEEWMPLGNIAGVCQCHPHSVRIDMDRFKVLLARYYKDVFEQGRRLSYAQWATDLVKKRRSEALRSIRNESDIYGPTGEGDQTDDKKSFHLRVIENCLKVTKDRKRPHKRSSPVKPLPMWKWAHGRKGKACEYVSSTRILCKLDCQGGQPGEEGIFGSVHRPQAWFVGTVVEVKEDYCRVHFQGMQKKADIWVHSHSEGILLEVKDENISVTDRDKTSPMDKVPIRGDRIAKGINKKKLKLRKLKLK
mmetsp:Transcript_37251/g.86898  ORF Transcript_37251/g.86898 Transcript_37251/m.86898 type:complete len:349 (+) Transcript_37251:1566-2612(+)